MTLMARAGLRSAAAAAAGLAIALALTVGQQAPASAAKATASGAAGVKIVDFAFRPGALSVAKGAKVVFANRGAQVHTATEAGAFDTGRIKPGHAVALRFTHKGTFRYHCKIHPFMHGKIVVG